MIDLNKNQLVEGDVMVKAWDDYNEKHDRFCGYLAIINHKSSFPFRTWPQGKTGKDIDYDYEQVAPYKNAELIQPKYKVKEFYDLVAVLKGQGFFPNQLSPSYLSSTYYTIMFRCEMFEYCGKSPYENKFNWHPSWLEEINE